MFTIEIQDHASTTPVAGKFATREEVQQWVDEQDELLERFLDTPNLGEEDIQPPVGLLISEGSYIVVKDMDTGKSYDITDTWEEM